MQNFALQQTAKHNQLYVPKIQVDLQLVYSPCNAVYNKKFGKISWMFDPRANLLLSISYF
jgi:hypothetical protein